ncbi:MAG TPA: DoxX family protein [Acidimicrobiia bacterium]|nr:DoxX family protein [Acidimicrobiia bacterium]
MDDGVSAGLLVLRVTVGAVMIAHGYNHIFRGGKIAGTAGWFESLGMKPGKLHAWLASLTELGAGAMLLAGFLMPLAAAGVVGVMLVAWITNHMKNGFFIFRPGEGWEYVMTLCMCGVALGALGAGTWSLDDAFDIDWNGWSGLLTAVVAGGGGALVLLAIFWRPTKPDATA